MYGRRYTETGSCPTPVSELFSAVVDFVGNLLGPDTNRRWHPLVVVGRTLLALVAVALVALWATG
jgi:hypothetical protein